MKYLSIILFFILSCVIFAQPNVNPNPNQIGLTYEQVITMYPYYYTSPDWWVGQIAYYNTGLPGRAFYYFGRNTCYGIQYIFASEDSVESISVYNQYYSYVKDSLSGYFYNNWGEGSTSKHHFWGQKGTDGGGAIMWDASRMVYTHMSWDAKYYLVWLSIYDNTKTYSIMYPPKTKPKMRLQ